MPPGKSLLDTFEELANHALQIPSTGTGSVRVRQPWFVCSASTRGTARAGEKPNAALVGFSRTIENVVAPVL